MKLHKRFDMMTTKRLYLLLLGFALIGMKAQARFTCRWSTMAMYIMASAQIPIS